MRFDLESSWTAAERTLAALDAELDDLDNVRIPAAQVAVDAASRDVRAGVKGANGSLAAAEAEYAELVMARNRASGQLRNLEQRLAERRAAQLPV